MKKNIALAILLMFSVSLMAQNKYKYVLIPLQVSEIGDGMNPHGISYSAMKALNSKGIKSVFRTDDLPDDYCETLSLSFKNVSSMLRIKLKLELKDCNNVVVWEEEGMARSKDYREGYAEAITVAFKELDELPEIKNPGIRNSIVKQVPVETEEVKEIKESVPVTPAELNQKISELEPGKNHNRNNVNIYRPKQLFYNYKYFIDILAEENGGKKLKILDGELLGYENLQVIAILNPSGIEGVFTVKWTKPDGNTVDGVANLSDGLLKISLKHKEKTEVISLYKY